MPKWRIAVLALIFLIYGMFSESTPDNPGLAEAALGALLIILVGRGPLMALGGNWFSTSSPVPWYANTVFAWFLIVPSITGLFRDAEIADYIRDVLPLMYLMLPVLALYNMKEPERYARVIIWGLSFVGVMFALRFFRDATGELFVETLYGGLQYFAMDPAVIFGATFLTLLGLQLFYEGKLISSALSIAAGGFTYLSVVSSTLRGQIVLVALCVTIFALLQFCRRPSRFSSWAPIVIALILMSTTNIVAIVVWALDAMTAKTTLAGGLANTRDIEMLEVFSYVSENWQQFLFGGGWGTKLYFSTSGGTVRYTHNTLLFVLWKTGAVGLVIFLAYAVWLAYRFLALGRAGLKEPRLLVLWFAILNTLIIHGFLEVGYKMLTLGMVLCLIVLTSKYPTMLRQPASTTSALPAEAASANG